MDESGEAAELIVKIVQETERRLILYKLQNFGADATMRYLEDMIQESDDDYKCRHGVEWALDVY